MVRVHGILCWPYFEFDANSFFIFLKYMQMMCAQIVQLLCCILCCHFSFILNHLCLSSAQLRQMNVFELHWRACGTDHFGLYTHEFCQSLRK